MGVSVAYQRPQPSRLLLWVKVQDSTWTMLTPHPWTGAQCQTRGCLDVYCRVAGVSSPYEVPWACWDLLPPGCGLDPRGPTRACPSRRDHRISACTGVSSATPITVRTGSVACATASARPPSRLLTGTFSPAARAGSGSFRLKLSKAESLTDVPVGTADADSTWP